MKWIVWIGYLYIAFYTIKFALTVLIKQKNKVASIFIGILALSLAILPLFVL